MTSYVILIIGIIAVGVIAWLINDFDKKSKQ